MHNIPLVNCTLYSKSSIHWLVSCVYHVRFNLNYLISVCFRLCEKVIMAFSYISKISDRLMANWKNLSIDWLSNISIYSSLPQPPPPSSSLSEVRQEYHIDTQLIHSDWSVGLSLGCLQNKINVATTLRCINSIKSEEQDCYSALIDKLLVDSLSNKSLACLMSPCIYYCIPHGSFGFAISLSLSLSISNEIKRCL